MFGERDALALRALELAVDKGSRFGKLLDFADHGKKQVQIAPLRACDQRAHLVTQQRRPIERHADGAPSHRRVFLAYPPTVARDHVASKIKRSKHHGLAASGFEHLPIERNLVP